MPAYATPGEFCLEGEWKSHLRDRSSIEHLLRMLESLGYFKAVHALESLLLGELVGARQISRRPLGWFQLRMSDGASRLPLGRVANASDAHPG